MCKADNRNGRSRREICLKLTINTSKKKSQRQKHNSKQRRVHSTPEEDFTEVLDMLQVVNKDTQCLLLTFNGFHISF